MTGPAPLQTAYSTPTTRVVFGAGARTALGAELGAMGIQRALVVTTAGRVKGAREPRVKADGRVAGVFTGARVHVPVDTIRAAMAKVSAVIPDAVVSFGGGSATGLGKAIVLETSLPLIAIPTTYSGSEMTSIWGFSDGERKATGRDPRVAPKLVLYDPELTYDLPAKVSAASGMNAMAHAIEALYAPDATPFSALFAEAAINRLAASLPIIVRTPGDATAREDAMLGAHLAGRALDLTTMGLEHRLAHLLGGSFGLPHAETHAVLLPYVVALNAPAAPGAMARVASALGVDDAVVGLFDLARKLPLPRVLAALGLARDQVPRAAALAAAGRYSNPRDLTESELLALLEHAWGVPRG